MYVGCTGPGRELHFRARNVENPQEFQGKPARNIKGRPKESQRKILKEPNRNLMEIQQKPPARSRQFLPLPTSSRQRRPRAPPQARSNHRSLSTAPQRSYILPLYTPSASEPTSRRLFVPGKKTHPERGRQGCSGAAYQAAFFRCGR